MTQIEGNRTFVDCGGNGSGLSSDEAEEKKSRTDLVKHLRPNYGNKHPIPVTTNPTSSAWKDNNRGRGLTTIINS